MTVFLQGNIIVHAFCATVFEIIDHIFFPLHYLLILGSKKIPNKPKLKQLCDCIENIYT